ncbi:MAG: hypothetical protein A2136_06125 [Chloroflexi bacterium RBG_16_54_11]|nr:MAG: hypothetical protein A2136_06125 [Chloroflexi bacterium RBG_16_54_11]
MPNSRQKIFNYLLEHESATVEELSKVFRVTPADIRHHLSILVQQGSLKIIGQKAPPAKGRPTQIFSASQRADRTNLDHLSDALLSTLMGTSRSGELIRSIADWMSSDFKTEHANPTRRLYSTIHSLNRMNYQAHWEAHVENPRIILGHCPYRAILDQHPELCQVDASLLENLLNTPVRQVEKLVTNTKGLPRCVFLVDRSA